MSLNTVDGFRSLNKNIRASASRLDERKHHDSHLYDISLPLRSETDDEAVRANASICRKIVRKLSRSQDCYNPLPSVGTATVLRSKLETLEAQQEEAERERFERLRLSKIGADGLSAEQQEQELSDFYNLSNFRWPVRLSPLLRPTGDGPTQQVNTSECHSAVISETVSECARNYLCPNATLLDIRRRPPSRAEPHAAHKKLKNSNPMHGEHNVRDHEQTWNDRAFRLAMQAKRVSRSRRQQEFDMEKTLFDGQDQSSDDSDQEYRDVERDEWRGDDCTGRVYHVCRVLEQESANEGALTNLARLLRDLAAMAPQLSAADTGADRAVTELPSFTESADKKNSFISEYQCVSPKGVAQPSPLPRPVKIMQGPSVPAGILCQHLLARGKNHPDSSTSHTKEQYSEQSLDKNQIQGGIRSTKSHQQRQTDEDQPASAQYNPSAKTYGFHLPNTNSKINFYLLNSKKNDPSSAHEGVVTDTERWMLWSCIRLLHQRAQPLHPKHFLNAMLDLEKHKNFCRSPSVAGYASVMYAALGAPKALRLTARQEAKVSRWASRSTYLIRKRVMILRVVGVSQPTWADVNAGLANLNRAVPVPQFTLGDALTISIGEWREEEALDGPTD